MTREEAIKELSVEYLGDSEKIIEAKKIAIKALEQEPKTGHWKRISMDQYLEHVGCWYRCDMCGKYYLGDTGWCSDCGYKTEAIYTDSEMG